MMKKPTKPGLRNGPWEEIGKLVSSRAWEARRIQVSVNM
jgi:hypothetical protein